MGQLKYLLIVLLIVVISCSNKSVSEVTDQEPLKTKYYAEKYHAEIVICRIIHLLKNFNLEYEVPEKLIKDIESIEGVEWIQKKEKCGFDAIILAQINSEKFEYIYIEIGDTGMRIKEKDPICSICKNQITEEQKGIFINNLGEYKREYHIKCIRQLCNKEFNL